jgi:hypothetical protein
MVTCVPSQAYQMAPNQTPNPAASTYRLPFLQHAL